MLVYALTLGVQFSRMSINRNLYFHEIQHLLLETRVQIISIFRDIFSYKNRNLQILSLKIVAARLTVESSFFFLRSEDSKFEEWNL